MKAHINVEPAHDGEGSVSFDMDLPWSSFPPIGSEFRIDGPESHGSVCVFLTITGYDIFADIEAGGKVKVEERVRIFTDFNADRSDHSTIADLDKWFNPE